jgi:hypothetical protein
MVTISFSVCPGYEETLSMDIISNAAQKMGLLIDDLLTAGMTKRFSIGGIHEKNT